MENEKDLLDREDIERGQLPQVSELTPEGKTKRLEELRGWREKIEAAEEPDLEEVERIDEEIRKLEQE